MLNLSSDELIPGVDFDDETEKHHECQEGCFCTWDEFSEEQ